MGTGGGFSVSLADLRAHAGRVDTVADHLGTAEQASRTVRVDIGAYGQLCVMVPILIGALDDLVAGGIATARTSVRDTAGRLCTAADAYQGTEETNQAAIDRLSGSV
jgi:hypothetical protein